MSAMDPTAHLNPEQKAAATHRDGPCLVLAGPGTGKTATLVARVAWMIGHAQIPPDQILTLTFARKAAAEIRERIARQADLADPRRLHVGTFHAVALFLQRHDAEGIRRGEPAAFPRLAGREIIDEAEAARLARQACRDLPCDDQDAPERISGFKDRLLTPQEALAETRRRGGPDLAAEEAFARGYAAYQQELDRRRAIDFGDLLMGLVLDLRAPRNQNLLEALRRKWRYLLVDEYQDLNPAQHALISLLAGPDDNLWAVGDDDQSIYGWRHTDPQALLHFAQRHKGAKILYLERNYRSTPQILAVANALIGRNAERFRKTLQPTRPPGPAVEFLSAPTPDHEGRLVADRLQDLLRRGLQPRDVAVLARTAAYLAPVERALTRRRIPCRTTGGGFWTQREVRQALAAILARCGLPLPQDLEPAPAWMTRRIEERQRGREFQAVARLALSLFEETPPKRLNEERKAAWKFHMQQLGEEIRDAGSAEAVLQRLRDGRPRGGDVENAVTLSTIHAAKGLEWPAVFLVACEEGALPHARAESLPEERRLAYVALTRARDRLVLTRAEERLRQPQKPSRFLAEAAAGIARTG
jgi:DNA helicase-2/ATP-dependent DNA helicase PcrA